MKRSTLIPACLLALVVVTVNGAVPPDSIDGSVSDDEAMQRLLSGEILVENARTDESGGSVRVQALMHGDIQVLWDFIASCESVYQYVDGLRSCEVLSIDYQPEADVTLLSQSVKKSWVIPKIEYVIRVRRQPLTRVDFELVEGELRFMEGGWRFERLAQEAGIVVTHQIRVRPSFPVPRWLLRRSMRKDVPDMLACLRGLIDGSGAYSRDKDLKRCPKQKARK